MKPYQKLLQHWSMERLTIATGASEEEMRQFEMKYRVTLSSSYDFSEYLLHMDGMAQMGGQDCDERGFSFWPLKRIKSVPEECADKKIDTPSIEGIANHFVFADYMQWSWAYAICIAPGQAGKVLQFGVRSPRMVADSFSEFVDAYLSDAENLYLPKN